MEYNIDFIFIDDVVSGDYKMFNNKKKIFGQIFNLGTGRPIKIKSIIQKISGLTKKMCNLNIRDK